MPKFSADSVIQQQHKRYFYQKGGASPANNLLYGGVSGQFLNIESVENPKRGSITPINAGNPAKPGEFLKVGSESSPADFATATVEFMQNRGSLPRSLYDLADCATTFYEVSGDCKDLSDFVSGWNDYVKILSNGKGTTATEGGGSFDSDSAVMDSIDYTLDDSYVIGKLGFGEKAAVQVYAEVIDIVYGSKDQCSGCGPEDNGNKTIYAVTSNTTASAGEAPTIVYSTDGGSTFTELAITASASTDVPKAIAIVGNKLVVLFDDGAAGGYFASTISGITGIPSSVWTKVVSGFVSGNAPQDMFVDSLAAIYFAGDGGYVYKSTSILQGVEVLSDGSVTTENLTRIEGVNNILVVSGANAAVIYSINSGKTFSLVDNLPGSAAIASIAIVDDFLWWAIASDGVVYWTNTQGETAWNVAVLPSASAAITAGHDIVFINDEVGYISASSAAPTGFIYSTWNGGKDWAVSSDEGTPRLNNFPVLDRVNRIAYPQVGNQAIASNNVALAGLAGNGVDGIIVLGVAGVK